VRGKKEKGSFNTCMERFTKMADERRRWFLNRKGGRTRYSDRADARPPGVYWYDYGRQKKVPWISSWGNYRKRKRMVKSVSSSCRLKRVRNAEPTMSLNQKGKGSNLRGSRLGVSVFLPGDWPRLPPLRGSSNLEHWRKLGNQEGKESSQKKVGQGPSAPMV